jgi:HEAT repeat protein
VALLRDDHAASRQGERVLVVAALGKLGGQKALDALALEIEHPSWQVRLAAARGLARNGFAGKAEERQICQQDYYAAVRQACGSANKR